MQWRLKDEKKSSETKSNLDQMAQQVQHLFNFRNFYNQKGFTVGQRLDIINTIIELSDSLGGSDFIKLKLRGGTRFMDNTNVLYKEDRQILPNYHKRPLYVTALFITWN